jgi:hypothetical protein
MQELMDQGFLLVFFGHSVVNLGDDFDCVRRGKVQNSLPDFAQAVYTRDCTFGFGASASHAENELRHNMEKLKVRGDCVNLFFDIGRRIVFYRHIGEIAFEVKKVKANSGCIRSFACALQKTARQSLSRLFAHSPPFSVETFINEKR